MISGHRNLPCAFASFCILMSGCVTTGQGEAQVAYNICTDTWNGGMRFKPDGKALVAGVGTDRSTCFSRWSASSGDGAAAQAIDDCRKRYNRCFVYYQSGIGFSSWQKRINANNGVDPDRPSNGGSKSGDEVVAAVIGGLATGISGGAYVPPVYGSGGYGGGSTTASNAGSGGNCRNTALEAEISRLQSQASSMGICRMSRSYSAVLRRAAQAYRNCQQYDAAADAEAKAQEADATAAASCANGY